MTYNVFSGTLNPTHSLTVCPLTQIFVILPYLDIVWFIFEGQDHISQFNVTDIFNHFPIKSILDFIRNVNLYDKCNS